ncbi:bsl1639 [Bradyrhizobium diazoefficiens USDA 110]|uniref:Bsl1639 protein n=1 Tax=Bradyrhizobium diazoefficiens (strain JCM 10833 / BCRC 13528 / IAM 13628 / NBRC 14792 / USDA 110) TaxID=224911 RepID=Q89TY4_BRADU|nr:bsl1639 [Bradyrhizobium diazoefficiens USDA 110]
MRILPNAESCLRLVRALTVERHEAWLEDHRHLNMDLPKEHKEALRRRPDDAQAHQGDARPPLRRRRSPGLRFCASERRRLRGDGSAGSHNRFC